MKKKINKKTIAIIVSIALAATALFTSTYSLFYGESVASNPEKYSTGVLAITAKSKSENITLDSALPMSDSDGANTDPYVFTIKNIGNIDYKFDIKLLSTGSSNLISSNYIKLKIDNGSVTTLSSLTNSIIKSNITLKAQESIDISIRVWLASNTPNSEIGKTFNSKIVANGQAIYTESNYGIPASLYISNLFYSNSTVSNNGITYNVDTSNSLIDTSMMYKNMGGNILVYSGDINGNGVLDADDAILLQKYLTGASEYSLNAAQLLVAETYNDGDISMKDVTAIRQNIIYNVKNVISIPSSTAGASNFILDEDINKEIRYYGQDPNNYIDIGDRDSSNNPILWRIIGVFDGKLKLIRSSSIGSYAWDSNNVNDWSTASLKTYLNSGGYYTSGITDDAKNRIAEVTWYLGGFSSSSAYPNQIYAYERGTTVYSGRSTTSTGKIALAYPSDYGYATDLSQCNQNLNNYNNNANNYACRGNNWMWYTMTGATTATSTSGANNLWLLTTRSSSANSAWSLYASGGVNYYNGGVNSAVAVSPVLYLSSEQVIESGSGTSSVPYVLSA